MKTRTTDKALFNKQFQMQVSLQRWLGLAALLATVTAAWAQDPSITSPPTNQTVSIGATATFQVRATTAYWPLSYQWQYRATTNDLKADLPGATMNPLTLTNVAAAQAGYYSVIVSNSIADRAISDEAQLIVDPTFVKITGQPIVEDSEPSQVGEWCDYDGDGFLDVFVANGAFGSAPKSSLYHNERKGLFTRVTNALTTRAVSSWAGLWGDYNNDGRPDLYVAHPKFFQGYVVDDLFRNDDGGVFTRVPTPWLVGRDRNENSPDLAWADLDGDGWIDLVACAWYVTMSPYVWEGLPNVVFRNLGDGGFTTLTSSEVGSLATDSAISGSPCFADFDNDGDCDVYVPLYEGQGQNRLHRNNGYGFFEDVQLGSLPETEGEVGGTEAWADYDNDGYFDLLVTHLATPAALHRNLEGAAFENVTTAAGLDTLSAAAVSPAWGDFDNDGDLDLFIAYYDVTNLNLLCVNNGNGTFTSIDVGSPIRDGNQSRACASWVDYDNDGFLDLFVTCGVTVPAKNLLYRNNLPARGNTNHWLKVKLSGLASNRDGIGAKLRVKATIGGREATQLRQIAPNAFSGFGPVLLAHIGLGDATKVDVLRVEWPSGIVQELTDVAVEQQPYLTVVESQNAATNLYPQWTAQSCDVGGVFHATVTYPTADMRCVLEASTDLSTDPVQWTKVQVRTNLTGTMEFRDPYATNGPAKFYRVVVP